MRISINYTFSVPVPGLIAQPVVAVLDFCA